MSLNCLHGSSKVSSIVIMRYFLIISTIKPLKSELFPELLVPAISIVLVPSIRKLSSPAAVGLIIFALINNGSVHGLSLCLLKEYANPVGFNGFVITATLVDADGSSNSVSNIGFASSNGLPEINLNFEAQPSDSFFVGTMLV